jgi:hypothetical protein
MNLKKFWVIDWQLWVVYILFGIKTFGRGLSVFLIKKATSCFGSGFFDFYVVDYQGVIN